MDLTELKKWILIKDNNEGKTDRDLSREDEKVVPARNRHSAVVYQNLMFVLGGTTRNPEPAKYCNIYKLDMGSEPR